jgi:hypothetical protein
LLGTTIHRSIDIKSWWAPSYIGWFPTRLYVYWSMYGGSQQDFISIDLCMMVPTKTLCLLIYVWWFPTRLYFYWSMYDGSHQDFISIDLCMMVPNKTLFLLIYVWWCPPRLYVYWHKVLVGTTIHRSIEIKSWWAPSYIDQ